MVLDIYRGKRTKTEVNDFRIDASAVDLLTENNKKYGNVKDAVKDYT